MADSMSYLLHVAMMTMKEDKEIEEIEYTTDESDGEKVNKASIRVKRKIKSGDGKE